MSAPNGLLPRAWDASAAQQASHAWQSGHCVPFGRCPAAGAPSRVDGGVTVLSSACGCTSRRDDAIPTQPSHIAATGSVTNDASPRGYATNRGPNGHDNDVQGTNIELRPWDVESPDEFLSQMATGNDSFWLGHDDAVTPTPHPHYDDGPLADDAPTALPLHLTTPEQYRVSTAGPHADERGGARHAGAGHLNSDFASTFGVPPTQNRDVVAHRAVLRACNVGAAPPSPATSKSINNSPGKTRKRLPRESVDVLKAWLTQHLESPYPRDLVREELASRACISPQQVTVWFTNARKRIWQPLRQQVASQSTPATTGRAARRRRLDLEASDDGGTPMAAAPVTPLPQLSPPPLSAAVAQDPRHLQAPAPREPQDNYLDNKVNWSFTKPLVLVMPAEATSATGSESGNASLWARHAPTTGGVDDDSDAKGAAAAAMPAVGAVSPNGGSPLGPLASASACVGALAPGCTSSLWTWLTSDGSDSPGEDIDDVARELLSYFS